jgi:hypothetical protein
MFDTEHLGDAGLERHGLQLSKSLFAAVLGGIGALGDTPGLQFARAIGNPFRILKARA